MLEQAITHIANVAGDESIKIVVDAALKPVGTVITNGVRRYLYLRGDDLEELRIEVGRLRETLETFEEELRQRPGPSESEVNAEAQEPAFKSFSDRVFTIAANTTLESKRRLAGALMAQRLRVKTDTTEEILLRRALYTMEDLAENQLLVLAAAYLVLYGPALDADRQTFESRDALEAYLRPRYFALVRNLYDTLHFNEHEYGVLSSVGAVRLTDDGGAFLGRDSASPLEMWMLQHGVHQYDGLEGEWGTEESKNAFRARFPTIILLTRLGEGLSCNTADNRHRRLDDVILTPLGVTIGELVLQQLRGYAGTTAPM
jgi:hypothetical protein